ncbi:MAG: hypothetical protein H7Y42_02615 [Chitinophagaceae bacterium]|nr:hypothetical protein [Chitinophagaceae bacterium]
MAARTVEKTAGTYHLQNVKETASGFRLRPDGTFQFFFTYGALDRYGSGTWTLEDDYVILQSRPWGGKDFAAGDSKAIDQSAVVLRIVGGNPILLRHVYFSLRNGETGSWVQTNEKGEAIFPLQPVTTISAVFEFCPERFTHLTIDNPGHNYFEFRFEGWLMEVFFDKFPLKAEKYALAGKHPLLKGARYAYEKG